MEILDIIENKFKLAKQEFEDLDKYYEEYDLKEVVKNYVDYDDMMEEEDKDKVHRALSAEVRKEGIRSKYILLENLRQELRLQPTHEMNKADKALYYENMKLKEEISTLKSAFKLITGVEFKTKHECKNCGNQFHEAIWSWGPFINGDEEYYMKDSTLYNHENGSWEISHLIASYPNKYKDKIITGEALCPKCGSYEIYKRNNSEYKLPIKSPFSK